MPLKLNGSSSGYISIDAPAVAGTTSLTFPATNGSIIVANSTGSVSISNTLVVSGTSTHTGAATFSNTVTFASDIVPATSYKRNRIINGNMVVDQRNAGASVTPTDGQYTLDRWQALQAVASKYTVQQNSGSVTPPAGFSKYLGCTSSSAYTVGASGYFAVGQVIEGFNIADLAWGTANAVSVTLSFWARSSLTGTFGGVIKNANNSRSYPFTYTISAANTWEQKSITVAGDTSGTYATDNSGGIKLLFGLGVGSTYSGSAGSWSGGDYVSSTGATSVVGTNGATFYITGVQLEVGTKATPYEMQIYSDQLAQCQRYYINAGGSGGSTALVFGVANQYQSAQFPVAMRTSPTVAVLGTTGTPANIAAGFYGFYATNSTGPSGGYYTASAEL